MHLVAPFYTTEDQELESIKGLFPKKMRNDKIKNEVGIKKWEEKIKRKDIIYRANKYIMIFNKMKR